MPKLVHYRRSVWAAVLTSSVGNSNEKLSTLWSIEAKFDMFAP